MADVKVRAILEAQDNMSRALGRAGGGFDTLKAKMNIAAGVATAWALAAGKAADDARKTIVQGTGATGEALDSLVGSYENLAGAIAGVSLDDTSTAIADLNTHLGLAGPELETVATAALKAGANTNQFGAVARKMGLDVDGATTLLDQLTRVSQSSGVGINEMLASVQRVGPRFEAAGVSTEDLVSIVAKLAVEAGPRGARSALSELAEEVDKGNIPAFASLTEQVGLATGAVEETHAAGIGYLEQLGQLKDRTMAWVGENGNLLGSLGTVGIAIGNMGPMLPALATGFRAVWAAITGPVGLAVTAVVGLGAAFYTFRETIGNVLADVISFVGGWVSNYVALWEKAFSWIPGIGPKLAGVAGSIRSMVDSATDSSADWVDSWGEAEEATNDAAAAFDVVDESANTLIPQISDVADEAEKAAAAARDANAAFMEWAGGAHALNVALSAQALKSTSIVEGFKAAGSNAGLEFDLAFMDGPGGIMTTVPQNMMTLAEDGSWTLAGGIGGEAMAEATEAAVKGFDFSGMFTGIMSAFNGFVDGGWKSGLTQLTNVALSFLPPGMSQVAQAALGAFKGIWNKFFGKPGEAELAARASFDSIQQSFRTNLGDMAEYQEYFNSLVAQGWDENQAEVKAGFDYWGRQAGVSWEEIGALHTRYLEAVKAGNAEEIAAVEAVIQAWRDQSAAVADNTAAVDANATAAEHSAEEVARQFRGLTDDEAAALSQALLDLGSNANRAFTDMHDSALAAGNAVALLLNRLQEAVSQRWQASIGLSAAPVDAVPLAAGGPAMAGAPHWVGERGPELFVPRSSGTVVPNHALGGPTYNITINTDGTQDGEKVAEVIAEQLPRVLSERGVLA